MRDPSGVRYGQPMDAATRHHVRVTGHPTARPMVFAHGFGCEQHIWRHVAPAFERDHLTVVFDHAGTGSPRPAPYDPERHATLAGYARDVIDIVEELDLRDVVLVGHSFSCMVGALATIAAPERFSRLVMLNPSPRYVDDDGYTGGFSAEDIEELLDALAANHIGWSAALAVAVAGDPDRPDVAGELEESFCRMDPDVARRWARVTFLSDNRADLPGVPVPTLVVQSAVDAIAPPVVGRYVAEAVPEATLVELPTRGHCPHLSDPEVTVAAIRAYLGGGAPAAR